MIDINNVTFAYRRGARVLDGFSLRFEGGGVYGLLGRNGTGKSTLLYLMTGLLRPQRGEVRYDGVLTSERRPELLRDFFLVPEEYELPDIGLRGYVRSLKAFYPRFSDETLSRCLADFGLSADLNMGSLSMGQKKKVLISIALAANTRVLLLDEPTNGLDILAKSQFREAVKACREPERTVIVSTHQVHDVAPLLDHVVIIDRNAVLLNEAYDDESRPQDLEQLFIDTYLGLKPKAIPQEPLRGSNEDATLSVGGASLDPRLSLRNPFGVFRGVARWDMTINARFYLRSSLIIFVLLALPTLSSVFQMLTVPREMAGDYGYWLTAEAARGTLRNYILLLPWLYGWMLHNLTTRQGRIMELTLPATNAEKFLWHALFPLLGSLAVAVASWIVLDLVHWLVGCAMLGLGRDGEFIASLLRLSVAEGEPPLEGLLGFPGGGLLMLCFLSSFALGNACKYRQNVVYTLLADLGVCFLCFILTVILSFALFSRVDIAWDLGNLAHRAVVASRVVLVVVAVACWWLAYWLYTRAAFTSKRNH
ncbi:MAG: ABC transporter ATP-binding protein [Prevotellaceae bacterium]|nr:ABC transporter ATP-binding protein [Prevotellaceae bacterium]